MLRLLRRILAANRRRSRLRQLVDQVKENVQTAPLTIWSDRPAMPRDLEELAPSGDTEFTARRLTNGVAAGGAGERRRDDGRRVPAIFAHVSVPGFRVDVIRFRNTQIHAIDFAGRSILHVPLPGSDPEWLVRDRDARREVLRSVPEMNVPRLKEHGGEGPYFVSEFLEAQPASSSVRHAPELQRRLMDELYPLYRRSSPERRPLGECFSAGMAELRRHLRSDDEQGDGRILARFERIYRGASSAFESLGDVPLWYTGRVHGDLNPRQNVLRTSDDRLWFIDWELSRPANVMYDVVYMLIHSSASDGGADPLLDFVTDAAARRFIFEGDVDFGLGRLTAEAMLGYVLMTTIDMAVWKVMTLRKKRIPRMVTAAVLGHRMRALEEFSLRCERAVAATLVPGD